MGAAGSSLRTTVSIANLADYARSPAFATLASFATTSANLTGLGAPERIAGEAVSDIRRGGKLDRIRPEIYLPAAQTNLYPVRLADLAVRTAAESRRLVRAVQ